MDSAVEFYRVVEGRGEMKSFYSCSVAQVATDVLDGPGDAPILTRARVAIYDGPGAAPRVEEVASPSVDSYIENVSARVYELAREQGGLIPYTVIREVSENLIHADFAEPVISILDGGNILRFADQGPGISDKDRAILPGFTTASSSMKSHIRGVGSGLPIVRDYLSVSGGALTIEDNLGCGAVVTVHGGPIGSSATPSDSRLPQDAQPEHGVSFATPVQTGDTPTLLLEETPAVVAGPRLSTRQKQVLALVVESGSAGPSLVSRELNVAISTAYRDLASLEEMDLICADGGKRGVTEKGLLYLKELLSGS